MPVDQRDLQTRIAASTPRDTVRGLIFNAIFDTVEQHLGKAAALACDPAGKAHRTDFFSFPVADFLTIIGRAVDRLEPEVGSVDRAFFEVGYRAMANVFGSTLGATLVALAGRSPRVILGQTPTAYRGTVSYGERRIQFVGEREANVTFARDFLVPPFHCGVFTAALEPFGVKGLEVTGTQVALLDATYRIRWEA